MTRPTRRGSRRCPARGCRRGSSSRSRRGCAGRSRPTRCRRCASRCDEQQAGGAGADDRDAGADGGGHGRLLRRGCFDQCRDRPRTVPVQSGSESPSSRSADRRVVQRRTRAVGRSAADSRARARCSRGRAVQLDERAGSTRRLAGEHDRERRDHRRPSRRAPARRRRSTTASMEPGATAWPSAAHLGELAAQGRGIRDRLGRDARRAVPASTRSCRSRVAVGEQHEPRRRGVQRQAPGDARDVRRPSRGRSSRSRKSASSCSSIASCVCSRMRACTRSMDGIAAWRSRSACDDRAARAPTAACPMRTRRSSSRSSRPGLDQLVDLTVRRRGRQAGAPADLGGRLHRAVGRERLEHAHDALGDRVARRRVGHAPSVPHERARSATRDAVPRARAAGCAASIRRPLA